MPTSLRQYGKKPRKPRNAIPFDLDVSTISANSLPNPNILRDADVNQLTEKLTAISLNNGKSAAASCPLKKLGEEPLRKSPRKNYAAQALGAMTTYSKDHKMRAEEQQGDLEPLTTGITRSKKRTSPTSKNEKEPAKSHKANCDARIIEADKKVCRVRPKKSKTRSKSSKRANNCASLKSTEHLGATSLRETTWSELVSSDSTITKIAEASFAEIYRVRNPRGTSVIKVIRLDSPIKAQTKAQIKAGLVDEEPHDPSSASSELYISQWLAGIPGFVSYKEQFHVVGKATPELLATHQAFYRKLKRQDPDNLQFYPSPSRYLDDTKFLVVELGDAGVALEYFELTSEDMLWDIFFLLAIALARAEELVAFEHRDLHEGNLCVRRVREPVARKARGSTNRRFGFSGLDITVLDYGLSRAEDPDAPIPDDSIVEDLNQRQFEGNPTSANPINSNGGIAFSDLECDLSLFTSMHAAQCTVYRRMRCHLLRGDRTHLPPNDPSYSQPYPSTFEGRPLDWGVYAPYTNVLWLAYIYSFLTNPKNFKGSDKNQLRAFKKETRGMWAHLNPDANKDVQPFLCASDVVLWGVEMEWIDPKQLAGLESEERSILLSPRRKTVRDGRRDTMMLLAGENEDVARKINNLTLETIVKRAEEEI